MMPRGRLATRVYLFALAIVAVCAISIIYLPRLLFTSRIEAFHHRTIALLADDLGRKTPDELQAAIARITPPPTGPLAVYDEHGTVLAKSGAEVPAPPTAEERDEIAAHGDSLDVDRLIARTVQGDYVVYESSPPPILTTKTGILWSISFSVMLAGEIVFEMSLV